MSGGIFLWRITWLQMKNRMIFRPFLNPLVSLTDCYFRFVDSPENISLFTQAENSFPTNHSAVLKIRELATSRQMIWEALNILILMCSIFIEKKLSRLLQLTARGCICNFSTGKLTWFKQSVNRKFSTSFIKRASKQNTALVLSLFRRFREFIASKIVLTFMRIEYYRGIDCVSEWKHWLT